MSTEPRTRDSADTFEREEAVAPDNALPGRVDETRVLDSRNGTTGRHETGSGVAEAGTTRDGRDAVAGSPSDVVGSPSDGVAARDGSTGRTDADSLLVPGDEADRLRARWHEVQAHFVDDPRESVTRADELVGETIERLTTLFAERRRTLAAGWSGSAETEQLRTALRDYRSLFERLVS